MDVPLSVVNCSFTIRVAGDLNSNYISLFNNSKECCYVVVTERVEMTLCLLLGQHSALFMTEKLT